MNILKESGFTQDKINSCRTGLLQPNPQNTDYIRQTQQPPYNRSDFPKQPNTQIDMEINNINLGPNYYIDNQGIKTNKILPPNMNINNNPLIKALTDNGSLQFLQNIAAKVNSVNTISNNYTSNAMNIKNDIISSNIDQDLTFPPKPHNLNILHNYRNSQYIGKGSAAPNLYVAQNHPGKNNYTIVNTKGNNMSSSQANCNAEDDIMNSFNANNNYD
jgi:hypothetical protein